MENFRSDAVDLTMTVSVEYSLNYNLYQFIYLTLDIGWKEMKDEKGIEGFRGDCVVLCFYNQRYVPITKFQLEFTNDQSESIKLRVEKFKWVKKDEESVTLKFVLRLNPFSLQEIPKNEVLEKSGNLDGILIIEEHKVPVSKSLLSMNSDYFKSLFSSDFKEKNMDEIPIEDVKYVDFLKLMDFLWMHTSVLNDNTVEVLLALANRFLMPIVIDRLIYFLIHSSQLEFARLFYLAEKFNFEKLKEKCIRAIKEPIHVKILKNSEFFNEFSPETKDFLFDRIVKLTK